MLVRNNLADFSAPGNGKMLHNFFFLGGREKKKKNYIYQRKGIFNDRPSFQIKYGMLNRWFKAKTLWGKKKGIKANPKSDLDSNLKTVL